MQRVLVLLALMAFGLAIAAPDDPRYCSAQDRHIVEKQWESIWTDTGSSSSRKEFDRNLLLVLAEAISEVTELFKGVDTANPNGGKSIDYSLRIFDAIDSIINMLEHPDQLDALLDNLADQPKAHAGVKKEHFQKLGEILSDSLNHVIDDYNALVWKACFEGILEKLSSKLQA